MYGTVGGFLSRNYGRNIDGSGIRAWNLDGRIYNRPVSRRIGERGGKGMILPAIIITVIMGIFMWPLICV